MAAPDFPASPTVGQVYTAPSSGIVYRWDGAVWYTTGVPQGAYWTDTGTALTPTNATRNLTLPGDSAGQFTASVGTQTAKTRLIVPNTMAWSALSLNNETVSNTQDDATKPSWEILLRSDLDRIEMRRKPPGGALAVPLYLDSAGKTNCSLQQLSVTNAMLASGATIWAGAATNAPVSFSSSAAAWTIVVSATVSVRATSQVVLLLSSVSLRYVGSAAANTVYLSWMRDGGIISSWSYDFSAPVSGFSGWPVPTGSGYDSGAAVGSHTYSLAVYVANTAGSVSIRVDNPGQISAWVLS